MKNKKRRNVTSGIVSLAVLVGLLLTSLFACNHDFPNLIRKEYGNDTVGAGKQTRVLYIIVDGARGKAVQHANLPVLSLMVKNSVYTYDGLAGYKNAGTPFSDNNGWANMLTGVTAAKHGVTNNFDNNDLAHYPSFITRLKQTKPNWRTAAFCASDSLQEYLLNDATVSKSFSGDDKAAADAALAELNSDKDARVIVAEFQGAQKAGEQSAFDTSAQQYVDALHTIDGYIGNLVDAIKAGKQFKNERWLVVVASDKGGMTTAPAAVSTAYDDSLRNTFIVFYSPGFQSTYVPKPLNTAGAGPYIDTAVHLYGKPGSSGDGVNVEVPTKVNQSDFNIGTGDLTVEAKVKIDGNSLDRGNIPFLTKDVNRGSNGAGWSLWYNGGKVNLYVDNGSTGIEYKGGAINDGKWHTVGFKVYHTGSTIHTTLYTDGQVTGTADKEMANVESSSPLRIGYNDNIFGGTPLSLHITDVRIWKAAIADNVIAEYACYPGFPPAAHPNLNSLIGFWGLTKGSAIGDTIPDLTGNGRYALINAPGGATVSWDPFNDASNNVCDDPVNAYYRLVPNSEDIPYQIYQWMGVRIPTSWRLRGRAWVAQYSDVANPIF